MLDQRLVEIQEKLRREMRRSQLVARSPAMIALMEQLPCLSASPATILITGETGTGKELIARAVHYLSPRAGEPFIPIDCGALPENLIENELFGHARGAYTGAGETTRGLLQEADGGTVFLDEIEALPLSLQCKLLRFLQERQVRPLGQSRYIPVDVRVIVATNEDLAEAVEQQRFRRDLFYRLKVVSVELPPLRSRREDIPALVEHFIQKYASASEAPPEVPPMLMQEWLEYPWPGNVRELENAVQSFLLMPERHMGNGHPSPEAPAPPTLRTLAEVREEALACCEGRYFRQLLRHTGGNLTRAARIAGIDRKSLRHLLRKRGIDAADFRE